MSDRTPLYHGSCLCSGITYTISSPPSKVGNCFCPDCSKNAGGPCQTYAAFSTSAITVNDSEGLERTYVIGNTASGKPKEKRFCARCGCALWTVLGSVGEGVRFVRASLIEGWTEKLKPEVEIWTKYRPEGMAPAQGAKQFEEA